MKSQFVADGESRLRGSEAFRARLNDLRESIPIRHADQLSKAGFLRRWLLRMKMGLEIRRERKAIEPSPYTLYARSDFERGQANDQSYIGQTVPD